MHMGYGLLRTYGLWDVIFRKPTWWIKFPMGFKGLWVITDMSFEGADYMFFACNAPNDKKEKMVYMSYRIYFLWICCIVLRTFYSFPFPLFPFLLFPFPLIILSYLSLFHSDPIERLHVH